MKMSYKRKIFLFILFIFLNTAYIFASNESKVSAYVSDLTWTNQAVLPGGIVWLFDIKVNNNDTETTITIQDIELAVTGNASTNFDTVMVENRLASIGSQPNRPLGNSNISGNDIDITDIDLQVSPGANRVFSIYAKVDTAIRNNNWFYMELLSIKYSSTPDSPPPLIEANLQGDRRTKNIICRFNIDKYPITSGINFAGAEAGPFPVLRFSAGGSNDERLGSVNIVLREVNGRFWPGGNELDHYGDLDSISIYDVSGDSDVLVRRLSRERLPRPSLGNIYTGAGEFFSEELSDTIHLPWTDTHSFSIISIGCSYPISKNYSSSYNFEIRVKTGKGWGNPDTAIIGGSNNVDANYVSFGDKFDVFIPENGLKFIESNSTSKVFSSSDTVISNIITLVAQQWIQTDTNGINSRIVQDAPDLLSGFPLSEPDDNSFLDFHPNKMFRISLLAGSSQTSNIPELTDIDLYITSEDDDFNPREVFKPITSDAFSGISVWYNENTENINFDYNDKLLKLSPSYTRWEPISDTEWSIRLSLQSGFKLPVNDNTNYPGAVNFTKHSEYIWVRFLLSENSKFNQTWQAEIPVNGLIFSNAVKSNFSKPAEAHFKNNPPVIFRNQLETKNVLSNSDPFPVVSFEISASEDSPVYLTALQFVLERPVSHPTNFTVSDLEPLSDSYVQGIINKISKSGIALYRDNTNHPSNNAGKFDIGIDTLINLSFDDISIIPPSALPQFYNDNNIGVHLSFVGSNDTKITDSGAEFFLVFKTSKTADNNDIFRVAFGDPVSGDGVDPKIILSDTNAVPQNINNKYKIFSQFDLDNPYYVTFQDYDGVPFRRATQGIKRNNRFFSDWVHIHSAPSLVFENLTSPNQFIDAYSNKISVISFNLNDSSESKNKLNSIRVVCSDASLIASLNNTRKSGLQLWYDADNNGVFDSEKDEFITLSSISWSSDTEANLVLSNPFSISDTNSENFRFFLVARTSKANYGDTIVFEIPHSGIQYNIGSSPDDYNIKTNILTFSPPVKFENLIEVHQTISSSDSPLAVIGINLNDNSSQPKIKLEKIIVEFITESEDPFLNSDIASFTNDKYSGLSVWRDNTNDGIFDPDSDTQIRFNTGGISWGGVSEKGEPLTVDFTKVISADSHLIKLPDTDIGNDAGNNFFIVIYPSNTISYEKEFRVYIPSGSLKLSSGSSQNNFLSNVIKSVDNKLPFISQESIVVKTEKYISLLKDTALLKNNYINKNKEVIINFDVQDFIEGIHEIYLDVSALNLDDTEQLNFNPSSSSDIYSDSFQFNTGNLPEVSEGEIALSFMLNDGTLIREIQRVYLYYDKTPPVLTIDNNDETIHSQLPLLFTGSAIDLPLVNNGYYSGIDTVLFTLSVDTGSGFNDVIDSANALPVNNTAVSSEAVFSTYEVNLLTGYGAGSYRFTVYAIDKSSNISYNRIKFLVGNLANVQIVSPQDPFYISQGQFYVDFEVIINNGISSASNFTGLNNFSSNWKSENFSSNSSSEQKKIYLYSNNMKIAQTPNNWRGLSYTFTDVPVKPSSDNINRITAVSVDKHGNRSDTSNIVRVSMTDVISIGISNKNNNEPAFNPDLNQSLFVNIPVDCSSAKMKVFTLSGELVRKIRWLPGDSNLEWNGKNDSSRTVKNGVYLVELSIISATQSFNKTFPIAVVR